MASKLAGGLSGSGREPRGAKSAEALGLDEKSMVLYRKQEKAANLLDSAIRLPLIGGIGLDAVLGVVPVAGDIVSKLFGLSIIYNAKQLGAPKKMIGKMLVNSTADLVIGSIPVAGDVFDVFFRANNKNMSMLRGHLLDKGVM